MKNKNYENPKLETISINVEDVMTESLETPVKPIEIGEE